MCVKGDDGIIKMALCKDRLLSSRKKRAYRCCCCFLFCGGFLIVVVVVQFRYTGILGGSMIHKQSISFRNGAVAVAIADVAQRAHSNRHFFYIALVVVHAAAAQHIK